MEHTLLIKKVIAGGKGLGALADGMVVMVSGVLPGETVAVHETKTHRGFKEACSGWWNLPRIELCRPALTTASAVVATSSMRPIRPSWPSNSRSCGRPWNGPIWIRCRINPAPPCPRP